MNSITRIFKTAAMLLLIWPLFAISQSDRNHAIIEIKREATISAHGNNQASGIRVLPGERYVGYRSDAVTSGRLINILDTIYHITYSTVNPAYQTGETTNPNHHRAGLLRKPIITRLTKGGKEYYRLDVSVFKTYSDTVVIRSLRGSEILTFITQNLADIERSKIDPNTIIRISASGELTRFYDLPPYEEVEINRDYYQVFTRKDNVECFWEKESGFLYELSDNKLIKIQTATEHIPIVAEGLGNRSLTMYKGSEWKSEIISRTRDGKSFFSFSADYFSFLSDNLVYVLAVVILLVLIIIVLFSYDWMKGVVSKYWQRLSVFVFPTFTIKLNSDDTLKSLSEEYKVEVDEILKHNPNMNGDRQNSRLKNHGYKTVKIPKAKKSLNGGNKVDNSDNTKREAEVSGGMVDHPRREPTTSVNTRGEESMQPTYSQNDTISNDKVLQKLKSFEQTYLVQTKAMVMEIKNKIDS
jgi:hypothetical protein